MAKIPAKVIINNPKAMASLVINGIFYKGYDLVSRCACSDVDWFEYSSRVEYINKGCILALSSVICNRSITHLHIMIVSKFGGTSVGSYEAMSRSANIIADNPQRNWVVISATSGTTNELLRMCSLPLNVAEGNGLLEQISRRHLDIAQA